MSTTPLTPLIPPPALNQDKDTIREYAKASFDKEMEENRICYKGCAACAYYALCIRTRVTSAAHTAPALLCSAHGAAYAQVELGRGIHRSHDAHLPDRRHAHVESAAAPLPPHRRRHCHHAAAAAAAPPPPPPPRFLACRGGSRRL